MIESNSVSKIVVFYKDRLLRFGFELVEYIASKHDVTIEIVDKSDKTDEQELAEDMIQIVTVFSCRLHGKRKGKAKKLVDDLS